MSRLAAGLLALAVLVLAPAATARLVVLDLSDPTPRPIWLEVDESTDPAVVGGSYGAPYPATWSASGNVGTIVIDPLTHSRMRVDAANDWEDCEPWCYCYEYEPQDFDPITIEIDLTTLEVNTVGQAGGTYFCGAIHWGVTIQLLDTRTQSAGFRPPQEYCTSGPDCTIVPGSPFELGTGRMNLVGIESRGGCDGTFCGGPFQDFSLLGDLHALEETTVPSLGAPGRGMLTGALLAVGLLFLGRRAGLRGPRSR